jgi:hypothetical protein
MTDSTDQLEITPVVIMIAPLGIETENERELMTLIAI